MRGGITFSAVAPAPFRSLAVWTASAMPSHTTEEMTGTRPAAASTVPRVTSTRSADVKAKTSPVWPLTIKATMPSTPESHPANRPSSGPSKAPSPRNGTFSAGMMPL